MMPENESQGPVIRDRRRIDPVTGQVRDTGQSGPQRGPGPTGGQPKPGKHSVSTPRGGGEPDTGPGPDGTAQDGTAQEGTAQDGQGPGDQPGGEGAASGSAPARGATATAGATAPGPPGGPGDRGPDPAAVRAAAMLAERTADLQRLQAEYANYRKRVERDRLVVREQALANVLNELLPVLDDIGRAREHGELAGGFKSVAESLEGIVVKLGLTAYGENGDPFDPTLHEALMHSYSADVTEPTCVQILQPGYKVGERIIRPARVAVAEPSGEPDEEAAGSEPAAPPGPAADGDEPGQAGSGDAGH
jgi:molecular chaperone GrpE